MAATGTAPLAYQWRFNGTNLAGATGTNLTLANVQLTNAGNYAVVVTNNYGSVTSAVASLTVWVPPTITSQPQSQTNITGTTASFHITATGTAALGYQWQQGGVNLANGGRVTGALSPDLAITSIQASDAATYRCVVTNLAGTAISSNATLTLLSPPTLDPNTPVDVVAVQGTNVTLIVTATSGAPYTYQWRKGTNSLNGQTNSSLTLNPVQASDAATNYNVIVVNSGGSVTSRWATLTVLLPPAITSQPQSQTNIAGTMAGFTVTATGTAPLSYQWRRSGTNLQNVANVSGATTATLTLSGVTAADAASYTVVVTNLAGAVTSAPPAVLTVVFPPSITTPPQNLAVGVGSNATFSVLAGGTAALTYQWQRGGAAISGATGTNYTLSNAQLSDSGSQFAVVVTNGYGSITSAVAVLTVTNPGVAPQIVIPPQSLVKTVGDSASFDVAATGTAPLAYQWRFNDTDLTGATTNAYSITNVQMSQAGNYTVVVTNVGGSVTSSVAVLTIVSTNANVLFQDDFSGTTLDLLKWSASGTSVSANNGTATISQARADAGGVLTSIPISFASSGLITIRIRAYVHAQANGSGTFVYGGTSLGDGTWQFGAKHINITDLFHTWYPNNINAFTFGDNDIASTEGVRAGGYGGGNNFGQLGAIWDDWFEEEITLDPETSVVTYAVNGGAQVVGTLSSPMPVGPMNLTFNAFGWWTGHYEKLDSVIVMQAVSSGFTAPFISAQPSSRTNVLGTTASFNVTASGTTPFRYQWRFGGTNLLNQTNASLSLANVQTNHTGSYTVVVTNVAGSITSAVANLTVWMPVTITAQPQSQAVLEDANATLTVGAAGTAPLSYQWSFNGVTLAAKTNSSLTLIGVQTNQAGSYRVLVSNLAGSTNSAPATLAVQFYRDYVFANTNLIEIRDLNTALPYPSAIGVAGVPGMLARVVVSLTNFSHPWPSDVDALVVSPAGPTTLLMSDAGQGAVSGATFTFDDAAAQALPQAGSLVSGNYRPASYSTNAVLPAPAPGGPYGSMLASHLGNSPNGQWSLFVRDDVFKDSGQIANGWTLSLRTTNTVTGGATVPVQLLAGSLMRLPDGRHQFSFTGEPGRAVEIWGSADLRAWLLLGTVPNPSGTAIFTDPTTNAPRRFYQGRTP